MSYHPSNGYSLSEQTNNFISNQLGQYIAGAFEHEKANLVDIIDPATTQCIGQIPEASEDQVRRAIEAANKAFHRKGRWRTAGPQYREKLLRQLADAIEADADTLAELLTVEMGAPLAAAKHFEVSKAAETFRYYAGFATKIQGSTVDLDPVGDHTFRGAVVAEPVGVVAAIVPWNAPLLITAWKLAPALAAGCTVVLKPSEEASLVLVRLMQLIDECGFPPGAVNLVLGRGESVGQALLKSPGIDKVTFTGSTAVGKAIHRLAGDRMIRLSLELGGKSPVIVLADADLDTAVPAIAMGAFANSGQVCVAGSKVLVHRSLYAELAERLSKFTYDLTMGSGFVPETTIGPLVCARQYKRVRSYLDLAIQEGAKLTTTAAPAPGTGYFIAPTVITDLPQQSKLLHEEIFGPVITLTVFDDADDLIDEINDEPYGLAAMVWGQSQAAIAHLTRALRVGSVFVNCSAFPPVNMPTGGFRQSGIGRDLGSAGLEGYLEKKAIIERL